MAVCVSSCEQCRCSVFVTAWPAQDVDTVARFDVSCPLCRRPVPFEAKGVRGFPHPFVLGFEQDGAATLTR